MITGYICCAGDNVEEKLIRLVAGHLELEYTEVIVIGEVLSQLAEQIISQLKSADFDFEVLLPDEEVDDLSACIDSLGLWCSGFLVGFGTGAKKLEDGSITEDVKEALEDILQIAQIDSNDYQEDSDQRSYMEIVEYLRTACMLIFTELGLVKYDSKPATHSPTIH